MTNRCLCWLTAAALGTTVGCGGSEGVDLLPDTGVRQQDGGPPACGEGVYPCGPYGHDRRNTLQNLSFMGLRDLNGDGAILDEQLAILSMADFYRQNRASQPGAPPVNYLFFTVSAGWCRVCQAENRQLAVDYPVYRPQGIEFFETLFETYTRNEPADEAFMRRWIDRFDLAFPVALDPDNVEMGQFFDESATPLNMGIRLCDMQIDYAETGWNQAAVTGLFRRWAANPNPCGTAK